MITFHVVYVKIWAHSEIKIFSFVFLQTGSGLCNSKVRELIFHLLADNESTVMSLTSCTERFCMLVYLSVKFFELQKKTVTLKSLVCYVFHLWNLRICAHTFCVDFVFVDNSVSSMHADHLCLCVLLWCYWMVAPSPGSCRASRSHWS